MPTIEQGGSSPTIDQGGANADAATGWDGTWATEQSSSIFLGGAINSQGLAETQTGQGVVSHSHQITHDSINTQIGNANINHTHGIQTVIQQSQQTSINHNHGITIDNAGGGGYHNNQPAYYVLAFIMKI